AARSRSRRRSAALRAPTRRAAPARRRGTGWCTRRSCGRPGARARRARKARRGARFLGEAIDLVEVAPALPDRPCGEDGQLLQQERHPVAGGLGEDVTEEL